MKANKFSGQNTINIGCLIAVILIQTFTITTFGQVDKHMENQSIEGMFLMFEQLNTTNSDALVESNHNNLQKIRQILLTKLSSENDGVRFYAAYLLGEYRFPDAVDSLNKVITLKDNRPRFAEGFWDMFPAMEALAKIGAPSIPAMIRNLAESDDGKVRELSLKVVHYIDKDKDIVQLRLQKALAAEKDSQ